MRDNALPVITVDNSPTINLIRFILPVAPTLYENNEVTRQKEYEKSGVPYHRPTTPQLTCSTLTQKLRIDIAYKPPPIQTTDTLWSQIDDRTVDVLDFIANTIYRRAYAVKDRITINTDEVIESLGLQKIMGGSGVRGGYRFKHRRRVSNDIDVLESLWIVTHKAKVQVPSRKGAQSEFRNLEQRLFVVLSRDRRQTSEGEYYASLNIEIGEAFSKLLSSRRQISVIPTKLLAYDPQKCCWEKRIGKYLYRFPSRKHSIRSIVLSCHLQIETTRLSRIRKRFDQALNRLQLDGLIESHSYLSLPDMRSPGWYEYWLDCEIEIFLILRPAQGSSP